MATNTEVNVRINVDAKGADKSVGSIKKQLREATTELISMREKFGDSSTEAANAAKKVAELKDAIGDAKNMVDAFDPDAKFNAFSQSLQGVAGGFAAVQGAQALFGSESEAVSKTLAKVQGAMALSQGINSVLQAKDAFKNLGAVLSNNVVIQKALQYVMTGSFKTQQAVTQSKQADTAVTVAQTTATTGLTVAQNIARIAAIALRGAIMATGIGAIVIGIIALIQKIMEWTGVSDEAEKKQQAIAVETNKRNKEIFEYNIKRLQQAQELAEREAEIAGKSQKEILALKIKGANDEINALEKRNNEVRQLYNSSNIDLQNAAVDELEQNKKAQQDLYFQINKIRQDGRKADLDNAKAYQDQLAGLQQSNYLTSIKDEDKRAKEKARIDYENNIKKLQETEYSEAEKTELTKQYAIQRDAEIAKINQASYDKQKAKRDANNKEISDAEKNLNKQIEALNNEIYLSTIENEDKRAKEKLRIQFEAGIREIEQSKANENLKLDAIIALQAKYDVDIKSIDDKRKADDEVKALEKRQNAIDFENETFKMLEEARIERIQDANQKAFEEESIKYQNEIDSALDALNKKEITAEEYAKRREAIETNHNNALLDINAAAIADQKAQDEARYQAKIEQYQEIGSLAQQLSGIIGEQTAVGKALALSQIAIDTGVAISSLTKNSEANPTNAVTGGIAGTIQFATGLIRILANIKKAKDLLSQAKVPAKGGGGVNIPSGGGATIAPIAPTLNTTMLNQSQINQLSSATTRAYVVESDVSGSQERIQRLNRAARIN